MHNKLAGYLTEVEKNKKYKKQKNLFLIPFHPFLTDCYLKVFN